MEHRPVLTEYQECLKFWDETRKHPILRKHLAKIVNEGKRSTIQGARLKRIGMSAGLPDYVLTYRVKQYGTLWLEMKKISDYDDTSASQLHWQKVLREGGQCACFAYGWENALDICLDYLNGKL